MEKSLRENLPQGPFFFGFPISDQAGQATFGRLSLAPLRGSGDKLSDAVIIAENGDSKAIEFHLLAIDFKFAFKDGRVRLRALLLLLTCAGVGHKSCIASQNSILTVVILGDSQVCLHCAGVLPFLR